MTSIAHWAERPEPIEASASIAVAQARFAGDQTLTSLAIVDGGQLQGVVAREVILGADPGLDTASASIQQLMAQPRTLPAETPSADALAALLADGGCGEAVVLLDKGRYAGLITRGSLLKALQARAERSSEADIRREFVEMLGREIRTPMSGILAVADLLQRQPLTADAQAYVRTIVASTEGLLRLLAEAIDLAMGETGRLEANPSPTALRTTVDDIQAGWQSRASEVAVLVSYDGDPDLEVMVDGERLRQVFDHLIAAGVKTTRRGAVEASLRAQVLADGVRLEGRVRDGGPGLEPEHLARIFEPAALTQEKVRAGWTGLGPALSRRIIEAMGGVIRADSNVGEGVTVTFELMAGRLERKAADAMVGAEMVRARGVHVLVVDDNATNRMVAEGLCEMFDCTSECAEDGEEAVEAARNGRFDLILMDIKMPRMDGMEATRAIRKLPGVAGQVPIIALTANADPDDAKAYIACGMASVVEKPIKPERLLEAMNAALDRPAAAGGAIRAA
ncbi:MAG TPA: response regulator [Caulobacteraceae bacterium]|nr:response regulator [Caulobacteraceae bacterium]